MNISKFCRLSYCNYLTKIRYAHSEVSKSSSESEIEVLQKQDAKASKFVSGLTMVSEENYSPMSHISVLVKAGSRYENGNNLGVVHCLRNCASLSSQNQTSFTITRNIEQYGGKIGVTSTREYIMYSLKCMRDDVESGLQSLAEIVCHQAFKPWEVEGSLRRMNIDLAILEKNPEAMLMEALHKVAFRGGLGNSLFSLPFMVGKHDSEMMHDYVNNQFAPQSSVVVGLGIGHDYFENLVNKLINMKSASGHATGASKFGGGEVRLEADIPFTRAAIVAEGASLASTKERLSLGVLQCLLGIGSQIKHSCAQHSILGVAAAKSTDNPFAVSSININYSDTGLFGVYIAGHPNDMKQLVKSIVGQMRDVTKKLSEEEITKAKHALKTQLHLERENSMDRVNIMATQVAVLGQVQSIEELEKSIDALTIADITSMANKVMKTKPAMASVGPLHCTPYLDELL